MTSISEKRDDPRVEARWIFGLVSLGFALRVIYVLQMQDHPHHLEPVMDSAVHVDWARSIAQGESFPPFADRPFFRAPFYIWFLAAVSRLFGDSLLIPRLVQCLFGAATIALVHHIGRIAFDVRAARIAATIAATYWVLIYFDGELLIPSLIVPLNLLAIALTLRLVGSAPPRRLVLAGLVWGISAIARPNVLLFVPFVALWLLWQKRARWQQGFLPALIFLLACLAPILPITAYNTFVQDDFVLVSSQGGVNFWIGNNPDSNGVFAIVPGTREGWWTGYYDTIALAEQAEGRELRASEVSRHYASRAWAFILGEPAQSIPLLWRKLKLFFTAFEYGNNENITFFAHRFSVVPFFSIGFGVLAPLGLLGLLLCLRRGSELFPLWGFFFVYTASVVAFFVSARFRVPILPVLMVFAGHALAWSWDRLRSRDLLRLLFGAAFVLMLGSWSLARAPSRAETDGSGHLQLAQARAREDGIAAAIPHLRRAHELSPDHVSVLLKLGMAEQRLGNEAEALRLLERALVLAPLRTDALDVLLNLHFHAGRPERTEALATDYIASLARNGIEQAPEIPWFHLGRSRAARGEVDEAVRALEEALERDGRSLRSAALLGDLHFAGGDWVQAEAAFERAFASLDVALEETRLPFETRVYRGLVASLWQQGSREAACTRASFWLRSRPDVPAARQLHAQACPDESSR